MNTTASWKLFAPGLAALAFVAGGCHFNVDTTAKEDLANYTVEMHIVGINPSEMQTWKEYSVTQYFKPGDPQRESAVRAGYAHVLRFGPGLGNRQVLKKDNPVWRKWDGRNAKYLVVMAFLPGYSEKDDKPGNKDPRRKILPYEGKSWDWFYWGMDLIKLEVSHAGVTCLTPCKMMIE